MLLLLLLRYRPLCEYSRCREVVRGMKSRRHQMFLKREDGDYMCSGDGVGLLSLGPQSPDLRHLHMACCPLAVYPSVLHAMYHNPAVHGRLTGV